jgi:hypothetical protein
MEPSAQPCYIRWMEADGCLERCWFQCDRPSTRQAGSADPSLQPTLYPP